MGENAVPGVRPAFGCGDGGRGTFLGVVRVWLRWIPIYVFDFFFCHIWQKEENVVPLENMAAQLAAILRFEGEKGREAWSQLHRKLAEVASLAGDDPKTAVQALLKVASDASSPRALKRRVSKVDPGLLKDLVRLVADELNMTPLGDSEPVHMIDKEDNFCKQNVDHIIKRSAELSVPNTPYAVVSIVGVQSSGKSYLLNRLFGTKFQEMAAKGRRSQTTRGIMISTCVGPSLLLLDVEGFNGRERGEDTKFEKQAALFALTVSDLMMVNMPVSEIGLEQGGATQLFKILFQERPKLPPGLTKILVVLRDYHGEPTLDILSSDVLESLEEIWEKVNEESAKFKDYIEVNIIGLPHKISPEFPKEVTILRKLLSNIGSAKVPASGFSVSSSMFWDKIKKNKELDIPSHKVALAKNYCRDLVERLTHHEKYKLLEAEESTVRFREISHELVEKIKTEYDLETKQYDTDVRDTERRNLVEKLHKNINGIASDLAKKLQKDTVEQFKREFLVKNIKELKEASDGLYKYVEKFMSSCEDLKLDDSDLLSKMRTDLKEQLASFADQEIKNKNRIAIELAKKVLEDTAKQFEREFPKKNIKDMKEARDGLYKYVEKFTSSCEDLKVYHSDHLSEMLTYLEGRLASCADKLIEIESARKTKQKWTVFGYVFSGIKAITYIAMADLPGAFGGVSELVPIVKDIVSEISPTIHDIGLDLIPSNTLDVNIAGAKDGVSNLVSSVQDRLDSEISPIIHGIGQDLIPRRSNLKAHFAGAMDGVSS